MVPTIIRCAMTFSPPPTQPSSTASVTHTRAWHVAHWLPKRWRKRAAWAAVLLAAAMTALLALGVWAYLASGMEPRGLVRADASDPGTLVRARAVEDGVTALLSQPRATATDAEPRWSMALDEPSAAAWLATRLEPWLASRTNVRSLPRELRGVTVRFAGNEVHIVCELAQGKGEPRWVTLHLMPRVSAGKVYMPVTGLSVGRFSLPLTSEMLLGAFGEGNTGAISRTVRGLVGERLASAIGKATVTGNVDAGGDLVGILAGTAPAGSAVVRLPDGRRVEIAAISIQEGLLVLECVTRAAQ